MINVLIADDHTIIRNALKQLCEVMDGITVAAEAANGDKVLEILLQRQFDLLLLDLTMPGISGIELIERIHALYADMPILVFSMRNEFFIAKQALKAGASGYLTKECDQVVLMTAIQKVAAGERFVDPYFFEQMMDDAESKVAREAAVSPERLSERELQMLKYLAQGKSISEIADEVSISAKTVSTYKARLMQKMKFASLAELVLYAAEYGLNK